jgi:hypothetical protein
MTIATLATYKPRLVKILWDAVASLAPQVDKIYINVNPPIDQLDMHLIQAAQKTYEDSDCEVIVTHMKKDMGDLSKFYPLVKGLIKHPDDMVLICDDDLIYPENYAEQVEDDLNNRNCIISYGGKQLNSNLDQVQSFKQTWQARISQHSGTPDAQKIPIRIDVPLTCVTAFYRDALPQTLSLDHRFHNNGDVLMAKWARQNQVNIYCPPFKGGWFTYHQLMQSGNWQTIWGELNRSKQEQQKLIELYKEVMNLETVNA